MFGLGIGEIIVILVVVLLVFGPEKLPELARTLGKTTAELKRAMDEIKYEVNSPITKETPRQLTTSFDKEKIEETKKTEEAKTDETQKEPDNISTKNS